MGPDPMEQNWFFPPHEGIRLGDLANRIGAELSDAAAADQTIRAVAPVYRAKQGDVCYMLSRKSRDELQSCRASAIICDQAVSSIVPAHIPVLLAPKPHTAFALAGTLLHGEAMRPSHNTSERGIAAGAFVDPTARLEAGVDVRLVKELMGHEDIKPTVVVTEVTDAALRAAVLRLPWKR